MSVISLITGLVHMASSSGSASAKVAQMLTNAGVPQREVQTVLKFPRTLLSLRDYIDHHAEEDDALERGLLKIAAGQKDWYTLTTGYEHSRIRDDLKRLISSAIAKALHRLVRAVDLARPSVFHVPRGRYVREINHRGEPTWGEIARPYHIQPRPVSYAQFRPLARLIGLPIPPKPSKQIQTDDPILDLSQNVMEDWVKTLSRLAGIGYRIPWVSEWERGTGMGRPLVSLSEIRGQQHQSPRHWVRKHWMRSYANGFGPDPRDPLAMGGQLIHDPKVVQTLLREGVSLSAWEFASPEEPGATASEPVWEYLQGSTRQRGPELRHVGFRYFHEADSLRREDSPLKSGIHTVFRLSEFST